MMNPKNITLTFEDGCILSQTLEPCLEELGCFEWDPRSKSFRAKASDYKNIILSLRDAKCSYKDEARAYKILSSKLKKPLTLRNYQSEAITSWKKHEKAGAISLPTGAGKTIVAVAAILESKRSSLIIVPTIDLLHQWKGVLEAYFEQAIGILGDGNRDIQDITVSTYDSARLTIDKLGNQFGLLIVDECHHLPSPQYQYIALCSLAPYRLGLTATIQRQDGKETIIYDLLGPLVFESQITDLVSKSLAPYDVVNIEVDLTDQETKDYKYYRELYIRFLQQHRIDFSKKDAWKRFLFLSSRSKNGREAFLAHRKQKLIAQRAERKFDSLWEILTQHSQEHIIIFTDDNDTAYRIGANFFLPVITHKTKEKERKRFLEEFKKGSVKTLVSSRVLNEGVDVPEASVGIIISGTGTVREHVQRLGRVLRPRPGKRAVLYEIVARATSEVHVNQRRRRHNAYEGFTES